MNKLFIVESSFDDVRLDKWIRHKVAKIPQALIEKYLRKGKIKVNKKKVKSSIRLKKNDKIIFFNIQFNENLNKNKKFLPNKDIIKQNEELIIDNNDDFVVLNKSSGIPVQGGTKSKRNLIDIFSHSKIFDKSKPYSVHRLDKDTSGVFIIAKNRETAKLLTTLFRLRKIHKTYLALCHGEIKPTKGILDNDLTRYENNKMIKEKSMTYYKVIDQNSLSAFVELKPITGRKHQLRKQLYSIGNPIFGDQKYNVERIHKKTNKNLMLHSYEIKFMINQKKYTYRALLPDYFKKLLINKRLSTSNYL